MTSFTPTPTKRPKLSYFDTDFFVKLQKSLDARVLTSHSQVDDHHHRHHSISEVTLLGKQFLTLLSYGTDVNISFSSSPQIVRPQSSTNFLTNCNGDVNCDSKDADAQNENTRPLHENDHVRARMDQEALVRLLTSEGIDINCPHIAGDLDPLVLEEARRRFTILKALLTFGNDTNRIRPMMDVMASSSSSSSGSGGCDEISCEFCWNLQFLRNFGQPTTLTNNTPTTGLKGLVLNALLATGSSVNSIPCGNVKNSLQYYDQNTHGITELLVTNGHKVNSILDE